MLGLHDEATEPDIVKPLMVCILAVLGAGALIGHWLKAPLF